jgi:hypothetical protein
MAVDLDQHARELHRTEVTEQHTPAIHHFRIFCLGLEAGQHDTAVFDFQNSGTNGLVECGQTRDKSSFELAEI